MIQEIRIKFEENLTKLTQAINSIIEHRQQLMELKKTLKKWNRNSLNTCHKMFSRNTGNYMNKHVEPNKIWSTSSSSQMFQYSDNPILDQVKEKRRDPTVAFCSYQKDFDMIRHFLLEIVYRWMRITK